LKDCNYIACGRCIWTGTSSDGNGTYTSTTNCKNIKCNNSKIRSCPQRLSVEQNRLAHVGAFWLLSRTDNKKLFHRNDKRIHKGTAGYFGKKGTQHEKDPFNGKGFPRDSDDMKKIKFTDIDNKLSNLDEWDVCLCPADSNYSGFPLGTATD
jgi:hypothetical protein